MKCVKCGAEMVAGAQFCMMCGAKKSNACPKCGTELPDAARFCFNCGSAVKSEEENKFVIPDEVSAEEKKILRKETMDELDQMMRETERIAAMGGGAAPVWDSSPDGTVCDCAVGECDCDGSVWS